MIRPNVHSDYINNRNFLAHTGVNEFAGPFDNLDESVVYPGVTSIPNEVTKYDFNVSVPVVLGVTFAFLSWITR